MAPYGRRDTLAQPFHDSSLGLTLLPASVRPEVAGDLVALFPCQSWPLGVEPGRAAGNPFDRVHFRLQKYINCCFVQYMKATVKINRYF